MEDKNSRDTIPELMLERYLLGELPKNEMEGIQKILDVNPKERERLIKLQQSNKEFFEKYPSNTMVSIIKKRILDQEDEKKSPDIFHIRNKKKRLIYALPSLAIAALILLLMFPLDLLNLFTKDEVILEKGSRPHLIIYIKNRNKIEILKHHSIVREHDLVQISYVSYGYPYGMIFSVDGRGSVTLHYPYRGKGKQMELELKKEKLLKESYELDDAPDFERFFFITSKNQFDIQLILKRTKKLADLKRKGLQKNLDLPADFHQFSITLIKEKGK